MPVPGETAGRRGVRRRRAAVVTRLRRFVTQRGGVWRTVTTGPRCLLVGRTEGGDLAMKAAVRVAEWGFVGRLGRPEVRFKTVSPDLNGDDLT